MEAKFEYQVSQELAEQIAIERLHLLLRSRGLILKYPQLWIGILLGMIGAAASPISLRIGGIECIWTEMILSAAIGFALGFGVSLRILRATRSLCLANARDAHKKMGASRAFSWDSDGVIIKNSAFETKMSWRSIEKIQIEKIGVYGFAFGSVSFVVPKTAFSPGATAENFIQTWQTQIKQPPLIKTVSNP